MVLVVVVVEKDTRNYDNNYLRLCIAEYINVDRSNTVVFDFKINKKKLIYKKAKHNNIF